MSKCTLDRLGAVSSFLPCLLFATAALRQSKIRAKIILCFHAFTNDIFRDPFPLLWLQIRGGVFFRPEISSFSLSRVSPLPQHAAAPATPFLSEVYFTELRIPGVGSAVPRQAFTWLALFTTYYSLLTNSLQYPRPPFVYSIGWTSR